MPFCKMGYEDIFLPNDSINLSCKCTHLKSLGPMYKPFCICFLLVTAMIVRAQDSFEIYVDGTLSDHKTFADSIERAYFINEQLVDFWEQGFVFSDIDSISTKKIFFHKGPQYHTTVKSVFAFNLNSGKYEEVPFKRSGIRKLSKQMLDVYIRTGHPFASVHIDSIEGSPAGYAASLIIEPGPYISFDSLALIHSVKVNRSYLENALEIHQGTPFSEKTYRQIPEKINRISFLELNRQPDIAFEEGKSVIYLDLSTKATNSFEGILGLLPGQSATENLRITGYLNLSLSNLFRSGKEFDFKWNRFADQSQSLDLNYLHPYFLSSRIFLKTGFNLLKQDTTFLTQMWILGAGTYLSGNSEIWFDYQRVNGNLIESNELKAADQLADYQSNLYSIAIQSPLYHHEFGFQNDVRFTAGASVGNKIIQKNPSLSPEFYDSLILESLLVKMSGGLKYQVRAHKRLAYYQELNGNFIFNEELLRNEMPRPGGFSSVRGFNENFFFARHYALSRIELRQYFEEQSFFMVFCDQLLYRQNERWDLPIGYGTGLSLNTSNGLFTFALAMGSAENIPADLSNIKVHMGYTSRF